MVSSSLAFILASYADLYCVIPLDVERHAAAKSSADLPPSLPLRLATLAVAVASTAFIVVVLTATPAMAPLVVVLSPSLLSPSVSLVSYAVVLPNRATRSLPVAVSLLVAVTYTSSCRRFRVHYSRIVSPVVIPCIFSLVRSPVRIWLERARVVASTIVSSRVALIASAFTLVVDLAPALFARSPSWSSSSLSSVDVDILVVVSA